MQVCPDLGQLVRLSRLLPDAVFFGADDIPVFGCACDSRRVKPRDLFVALEGSRHDGHEFVTEAIDRGCLGVLSDRRLSGLTVPTCRVSDPREAYGLICHALAGDPSEQLKVIGVTGTNGKTTTSCLIASILNTAGYQIGLLGTLGYLDGKDIEEPTHTTPPADQLASWLARMARNGCSHAVVEVSSHALDQARVAGTRFDAACITNITGDHLDYHPTLRDYRLAKSKLLDYLPPEGFAVINADDPTSVGFLTRIDGPVLTVGIHSPAEITATLVERYLSEQTFLLTAGSDTVPVRTSMIGTHHVYNCLVAAAVGLTYGIDLTTVVRGLEEAEQVPGRLERIECGQPFGVFVDYAHTPDALTCSLRTLREVTAGRLICVFGAGGDRDRQKRPAMGRAVETGADLAVLTSDNPRGEDPWAIMSDVSQGFHRPGDAIVLADRTTAIHRALEEAQPGDCVLIAGKGHETFQIIGDEQIDHYDVKIAREWLYEAVGSMQ